MVEATIQDSNPDEPSGVGIYFFVSFTVPSSLINLVQEIEQTWKAFQWRSWFGYHSPLQRFDFAIHPSRSHLAKLCVLMWIGNE